METSTHTGRKMLQEMPCCTFHRQGSWFSNRRVTITRKEILTFEAPKASKLVTGNCVLSARSCVTLAGF